MLNKMLEYLSIKKWKKTLIKTFNQILIDYPLNINNDSYPDGNFRKSASNYLRQRK